MPPSQFMTGCTKRIWRDNSYDVLPYEEDESTRVLEFGEREAACVIIFVPLTKSQDVGLKRRASSGPVPDAGNRDEAYDPDDILAIKSTPGV
jgi:hypothetical protein